MAFLKKSGKVIFVPAAPVETTKARSSKRLKKYNSGILIILSQEKVCNARPIQAM